MVLLNLIKKLRLVALLLFIVPSIALIGTLLIHNYLVSFNFHKTIKLNYKEMGDGKSIKILCTKENSFCKKINFEKAITLGDCYIHMFTKFYVTDDEKKIDIKPGKAIKNSNRKIYFKITEQDELNPKCIWNSNSAKFYDIFPSFFEKIYNIKNNKKTQLGTNQKVNPFFYGETSISNIAKRYPINFFFKTTLYIGVILMVIYWSYFNKIFKNLNKTDKNYLFFIFGVLSAIFLFLHVFFLGWKFESEILSKLRRTYIVFFILFEILAQVFLIKKLILFKNRINNYINSYIVNLKLYFVSSVVLFTLFIFIILIFYNLKPEIDYILEWNYFLVLLVFYFLSFLLWKKILILRNPATS